MKKNAILLFLIFGMFAALLVFFSSQKPTRPLTKLATPTDSDSSSLPVEKRIDGTSQSSTAIGSIEEVSEDQLTITDGVEVLTVKLSKDVLITNQGANLELTELKKGMHVSIVIMEVEMDQFEVTQIFVQG